MNFKSFTTSRLLDLFETTANYPYSLELAAVRGFLMDELEQRDPAGFSKYLDSDDNEDGALRKYITA